LSPLLLAKVTATSCIGRGMGALLEALQAERSGLAPCAFESVSLPTCIGEVPGVDAVSLPPHLQRYDCRNNRLAELGLHAGWLHRSRAAAHPAVGVARRVGVFLGTSTAGILQTELAYRARDPDSGALPALRLQRPRHNSFSVVSYRARNAADLEGPAVVVSCACASSAKVFSSARRMIEADLIDAALVGGVDSLCLTTLYGFHSLQLSSPVPCRPFDVARDGISIGRSGGIRIARAPQRHVDADRVLLLGVGESSDAYHMSAPHPEGLGARARCRPHWRCAELDAERHRLHQSARHRHTQQRSLREPGGHQRVRESLTPCSSTKGATGHTLGAAGALEAVISALAIEHGLMPGRTCPARRSIPCSPRTTSRTTGMPVSRVLSNSFGFGGTNCSLIFGRAA
jgi:3-oxoacyl-[acyl-carrier-protein] synthase-1